MTDNILVKITAVKNKQIKEFIHDFLGHAPKEDERKNFTIMHSLYQSVIYYKGTLVGYIQPQVEDPASAFDR